MDQITFSEAGYHIKKHGTRPEIFLERMEKLAVIQTFLRISKYATGTDRSRFFDAPRLFLAAPRP